MRRLALLAFVLPNKLLTRTEPHHRMRPMDDRPIQHRLRAKLRNGEIIPSGSNGKHVTATSCWAGPDGPKGGSP
jgi:hypothetical protein